MDEESLQVLLVEDSPTDAQLFQHVFRRATTDRWHLIHVDRLSAAIAACQAHQFGVVLLDLRLPDSDGLETITQFHQAIPDVPIIILTMFDDEELALQAMAQGAQDYLVKDQVTTQLLRRSIRYTLERSQILTQLRASEKTILQALDKERELNQLKSYFISMVSHEFRNPLSSLRIMNEMLLRFDESLSVEKRESYAQQVTGIINHMCQLLDEVILLGRVDTGNIELDLQLTDLADFCDEVIAALRYSDRDQHPINLHYPPDLPSIAIDVSLLGHILTNLLSNAQKYSAAGQPIDVTIAIAATAFDLIVQDSGIGIPAQDQPKLFETFSRCSNVGKITGTGLGLAIVKRCVDVWGGTIAIESQLGVGTTIQVTLPRYELAPARDRQPEA